MVADCVPILICDPARGAAAAIHAGWRGTCARVAPAAIDAMRASSAAIPRISIAAIGPSVGPDDYEVGESLIEAFLEAGHAASDVDRWFIRRGAKPHLDLWSANRRSADRRGRRPAQIHLCGLSTVSHPDIFDSYRVAGERAGRMAAIIVVPLRQAVRSARGVDAPHPATACALAGNDCGDGAGDLHGLLRGIDHARLRLVLHRVAPAGQRRARPAARTTIAGSARSCSGVTASSVREIFIPNPPTMALMALPLVGLDAQPARAVWLVASLLLFIAGVAGARQVSGARAIATIVDAGVAADAAGAGGVHEPAHRPGLSDRVRAVRRATRCCCCEDAIALAGVCLGRCSRSRQAASRSRSS